MRAAPRPLWVAAAAALALAVLVALPALAGGGGPRVVVRTADGDEVASADARGGFALAYRHSVYRAPAEERFRAVPGGFELVAIASPSQAVLDYYALDGRTVRRGRRWVLRPAVRPQFETLALAGTTVGRRTLVAGGERTPLWRRDGRAAHLRITVEGGGR
jgi:hypothetical protein